MNLPPWLRAYQQTYAFHLILGATAMAVVTMFKFFADHNQFSMAGVTEGLIAAGIYLGGALQAGVKSPAFKPDGTVNERVARVVWEQAAVAEAMKSGR